MKKYNGTRSRKKMATKDYGGKQTVKGRIFRVQPYILKVFKTLPPSTPLTMHNISLKMKSINILIIKNFHFFHWE